MSNRHIIHHQGSPRPDGGNALAYLWVGAIAFVFLMALMSALAELLVVLIPIAFVAGIGYLVLQLKKDTVAVKTQLFRHWRMVKALEKATEEKKRVEAHASAMNSADYKKAIAFADDKIQEKTKDERKAAEQVQLAIDVQLSTLHKTKDSILSKAHKIKPRKLSKALVSIANSIEKAEELKRQMDQPLVNNEDGKQMGAAYK